MNKRILLTAFLFMHISLMQAKVFRRLTDLRSYANHYSEDIIPDNKDWMQPDFTLFYKSQVPNVFQWYTIPLGFWGNLFDTKSFQSLIKEVTISREKDGCDQAMLLQQFSPKEGDRFFIWTDLQGAFHSLVRDLTYLEKQGIIDNNFTIIDKSCYLVFNGNMVSGSAFQFESLSVLLQLMKMNPARVFYTKGTEEQRWYNFTLIKELKALSGTFLSNHEKMKQLIDNFFNTLPLGLYLTHKTADEMQVVVISNNEYVARRLDRKYLGQMMKQSDGCPGFFELKESMMDEQMKKIHLIAYITGENRATGYRKTKGLTMAGTIAGALKWIVFSSPGKRSQMLYNFFYDAFVELTVTGGEPNWTIALINQKIPEKEGFKTEELFNVASAESLNENEMDTELLLGSTMDLSRVARPLGKKIKEGLLLALYEELQSDALPDLLIKLIAADDEYTPRKTRKEVERLLTEKGIDIFIGSQGSASLEGYLDLVKGKKILVLFPFTGAPIFRKPELTNLIHFRGSYVQEGEVLARYAIKTLKAKTVVVFYQNDAFGRGALEGAERIFKTVKNVKIVEIPHARNLGNYEGVAKEIEKANPDAILFFTNANAIRSVIRQMGVEFFAGRKLLGLSVYEDAFEQFLKNKGLSFVLTRMVPDPHTSELKIAKKYRKWADLRNIPYDKISFELFINAQILFELLRTIDRPVTKEKIIAAAENMKNVSLGGLTLNFNPQTRELSDTLWLDTGEGSAWLKHKLTDQPLSLEDMEEVMGKKAITHQHYK